MASKSSDITRSAASGFPVQCNRVCRRGLRRLQGGARSRCSFGAVALCFGFRFQTSEGFLTVDGLHLAAFQFVIAAVKHAPSLHQFVEISGQCILQQLVGPASALRCEVVELFFNVWGEMYFHCLQSTAKPRLRQVLYEGWYGNAPAHYRAKRRIIA